MDNWYKNNKDQKACIIELISLHISQAFIMLFLFFVGKWGIVSVKS